MKSIIEYTSNNSKILSFPHVKQSTNFTCGTSAVRAVLNYYGIEVNENKLFHMLNTNKREGTRIENMINVFNHFGLTPIAKQLTIKELKEYLDQKAPIILLIQDWAKYNADYTKTWKHGHFVVAYGYNENDILLEDPFVDKERRAISQSELNSRWRGIDNDNKLERYGIAVIKEGE